MSNLEEYLDAPVDYVKDMELIEFSILHFQNKEF